MSGEWDDPFQYAVNNLFSLEALARAIKSCGWTMPAAMEVLAQIARDEELDPVSRMKAVDMLTKMTMQLLSLNGKIQDFKLVGSKDGNTAELTGTRLRHELSEPSITDDVLNGSRRASRFVQETLPQMENRNAENIDENTLGGFSRKPNANARAFDHKLNAAESVGRTAGDDGDESGGRFTHNPLASDD